MTTLSNRDLELVALGAAMGSNCVPCVEYHISAARQAGLTDPEIQATIEHADKIRQVPARKTLQAALRMLPAAAGATDVVGAADGCGCAPTSDAPGKRTEATAQPKDTMRAMMAKMADACVGRGQPAGAPASAAARPTASAEASPGCGCG